MFVTWYMLIISTLCIEVKPLSHGGRRGQDHMVVGFTTTYAIKCLSPLTL